MISIIIPTLNEEANIGKLLEHLIANSSSKNISEIIVVDGGSLDQTANITQDFIAINENSKKEAFYYLKKPVNNSATTHKKNTKHEIKLVASKKGRAIQMNFGVKHITGTILYFLHADSFPPKNFDQLIINEVKKGNKAGCFRMEFESNHWWLKLSSWFTQFNWRPCRGGDQSQFITKSLFEDIGGFDENYTIYEDNILINELYKRKQFVVVNKKLTSSARMFVKHGVWKLQYLYLIIYIKKWLGADANTLYAFYRQKIS